MAVLVSMGGFIFGYDTGQISGFLEMPDFLSRFADTTDPVTGELKFTNGRSGAIVALVSWPMLSSTNTADIYYVAVYWNTHWSSHRCTYC